MKNQSKFVDKPYHTTFAQRCDFVVTLIWLWKKNVIYLEEVCIKCYVNSCTFSQLNPVVTSWSTEYNLTKQEANFIDSMIWGKYPLGQLDYSSLPPAHPLHPPSLVPIIKFSHSHSLHCFKNWRKSLPWRYLIRLSHTCRCVSTSLIYCRATVVTNRYQTCFTCLVVLGQADTSGAGIRRQRWYRLTIWEVVNSAIQRQPWITPHGSNCPT